MSAEDGYHVERDFKSDVERDLAYRRDVIDSASELLVDSTMSTSQFFATIHHIGGAETRTRFGIRSTEEDRRAAATALAGTLLVAVGRICEDAGVEFTWKQIAELLSKELPSPSPGFVPPPGREVES